LGEGRTTEGRATGGLTTEGRADAVRIVVCLLTAGAGLKWGIALGPPPPRQAQPITLFYIIDKFCGNRKGIFRTRTDRYLTGGMLVITVRGAKNIIAALEREGRLELPVSLWQSPHTLFTET